MAIKIFLSTDKKSSETFFWPLNKISFPSNCEFVQQMAKEAELCIHFSTLYILGHRFTLFTLIFLNSFINKIYLFILYPDHSFLSSQSLPPIHFSLISVQ